MLRWSQICRSAGRTGYKYLMSGNAFLHTGQDEISPQMAGRSRPPLKGLIFDMDGTLTKPQNYMFQQMRDALGIDKSQDILLSIQNLPESEQEGAHEKIRVIEREAMELMQPQDGLTDLMSFLETVHLRKGICTRNFVEPTQYLLSTFLKGHKILSVLTREYTPPKPSPDPLLEICRQWDLKADECLMIGDGKDDLISAREAGMHSVLLANKDNHDLVGGQKPDYVIDDLRDLIAIVSERI